MSTNINTVIDHGYLAAEDQEDRRLTARIVPREKHVRLALGEGSRFQAAEVKPEQARAIAISLLLAAEATGRAQRDRKQRKADVAVSFNVLGAPGFVEAIDSLARPLSARLR